MKRRPGKFLRTVVVFLLLGAIINVAVAWGCAVFSRVTLTASFPEVLPNFVSQQPLFDHERKPQLVLLSCEGIGVREEWLATYFASSMIPSRTPTGGFKSLRIDDLLRTNLAPIRDQSRYVVYVTRAVAGWPLASFRGDSFSSVVRNSSVPEGDGFTQAIHSFGYLSVPQSPRVLPLIPLWPGFAVNTVFYAAILWMLFSFPLALSRRRRMQRGLCPACAYPVGTSPVCTECGTSIEMNSP